MGSCAKCCDLKVLFIVLVVSACLFVVSFVLAFVVFPDILYDQVNKATRLENGTEQFDRFVEMPFPLDFKVYIFNITNKEEVLGGERPRVVERGPYVYKQYRKKTVLNTSDEEDTISYTQMQTFEFDAVASAPLTEDDVFTVVNAPLMAIYQLAEDMGLAGTVDGCIKPTFPEGYGELIIKVPVRQLLFDGYNFCKNEEPGLCSVVNDFVCSTAATKRNVDTLPDYSLQFSVLNFKRRAPDGEYTVIRGMNDIDMLGYIDFWNKAKYTNYWGNRTDCSLVQGRDSTIYPPRIEKDSSLQIFSTDICRTIKIDYKREATYKDIDGYVFETNPNTLRTSTENPEDDCFCSQMTRDVDGQPTCFLDGLVDMQTCFGVPIVLSFPHFLWADEKYLHAVDGLSPNEDLHKIFVNLEPNTGTPLQGLKRVQLNIVLRPITGINDLESLARVVMPVVWIEEGLSLGDKYIDELKSKYFDQVQILDGVRWALIAVSTLLTLVFGGLVIRKKFFSK